MASLNVLVVEDNEHEQFVLRHLLEKFGFHAQVESTAEKALEAINGCKYAAIIMDLSLPGMSGIDCAREIRKRELISTCRTSIIALTANTSNDIREQALKAGMDDFISRPFDPEELRKVLLRHAYEPSHPNLKTLRPLTAEELDQNKWREKAV